MHSTKCSEIVRADTCLSKETFLKASPSVVTTVPPSTPKAATRSPNKRPEATPQCTVPTDTGADHSTVRGLGLGLAWAPRAVAIITTIRQDTRRRCIFVLAGLRGNKSNWSFTH